MQHQGMQPTLKQWKIDKDAAQICNAVTSSPDSRRAWKAHLSVIPVIIPSGSSHSEWTLMQIVSELNLKMRDDKKERQLPAYTVDFQSEFELASKMHIWQSRAIQEACCTVIPRLLRCIGDATTARMVDPTAESCAAVGVMGDIVAKKLELRSWWIKCLDDNPHSLNRETAGCGIPAPPHSTAGVKRQKRKKSKFRIAPAKFQSLQGKPPRPKPAKKRKNRLESSYLSI